MSRTNLKHPSGHSKISEDDLEGGEKLISERQKHILLADNSDYGWAEEIEDITDPRVGTNFIFECSTRYLTSESNERVRHRIEHEKIKFIFIIRHAIFCLLHKHF